RSRVTFSCGSSALRKASAPSPSQCEYAVDRASWWSSSALSAAFAALRSASAASSSMPTLPLTTVLMCCGVPIQVPSVAWCRWFRCRSGCGGRGFGTVLGLFCPRLRLRVLQRSTFQILPVLQVLLRQMHLVLRVVFRGFVESFCRVNIVRDRLALLRQPKRDLSNP